MAVGKKDYYEILGISKDASDSDIKKAYRKLAHKYHPDKGDGDEAKFKEVSEAYQILSDPKKRSQYDQFGHMGFDPGSDSGGGYGFNGQDFSGFDFSEMFSGGGFGDIFDTFFGGGRSQRRGPAKGNDLETRVEITLKEASTGTEKNINLYKLDICDECKGTGAAKGSKTISCSQCKGTGQIHTVRRTVLGQMSQVSICSKCKGLGKYPENSCSSCKGEGRSRKSKTLKIKIPAGVDSGSVIKLSGEGEAGEIGSIPGDLYVHILVKSEKGFQRQDDDLIKEIGISFADAALGITARVESLDGKIDLKIPSGTQSGRVFKVSEKGIKHLNRAGYGDLLVKVNVITPSKLSSKQKELFEKLKEEEGKKGFWGF